MAPQQQSHGDSIYGVQSPDARLCEDMAIELAAYEIEYHIDNKLPKKHPCKEDNVR